MIKAPTDFIWSSLPVPALLINPEDIITEANPPQRGFLILQENLYVENLFGIGCWSALL